MWVYVVFEVIFQGKVIEGADEQEVRANVGRMFKADEAKLNALFSGKTVVIKGGLDETTAQKYVAAMKKAGAKADIRSLAPKTEPKPQNPASFMAKDFDKPSMSTVAKAHEERQQEQAERAEKEKEPLGIPVPEVSEASSDEVQAAMNSLKKEETATEDIIQPTTQGSQSQDEQEGQKNVAGDFSIAPTGSMILPESKEKPPEAPDTDHLTIKPMDGYLVEPEPEKEVKVPDTSHIKLKD